MKYAQRKAVMTSVRWTKNMKSNLLTVTNGCRTGKGIRPELSKFLALSGNNKNLYR